MPLRKRASVEAQRMMREAFTELERVITISDRAQLKNLTLGDVQQAALQIEKQLAASQSLRNMRRLVPLFTSLEHYSQAIEVLCNGTPYLPWLWAPIKLVLKISADYIEAFEQIIKVYSRLAEPLARFSLFDRSFSNNIEVQNTLAVYYSDILKFHGEAYQFVRRNAWQRLFATSWGRFHRRFDNILDDLKAHEDLVDKTVNAANLSEAKEMREKLEDWRQQEIIKFKKEEEERTSTEFRAILSVLKVDETHQIKVFDNLVAEANQTPGSCSWILQQPKIQSWARCERDTQFLVLHGFVGSGKSVLAAQIATFLRSSEQCLVATHFCTYLYPESTDYNYIMRSLMIQLIRLDPELIALSYDWLVLKKKTTNNTVVEQLLRLLVEALGTLPEKQKTLHIIIDGLDECDDSTAVSVVKTLNKLISTASSSGATVLKVLLCTQLRPEIAKIMKKKHQVSLSSEKDHLNKAIRDYTLQRIEAIRPNLSQLRITDEDVAALASQITQKSDGMFLWAKLVMEYINRNFFYHRDEILKAAISLPRELGKFYGRMLSQIMVNFDERSAERIRSVLSWIAFARRPLRSQELLSALAFDAGQDQVDDLVPAYILDRCEPLIQKQSDSSYSFVHVSVRDFLQSSDSALLITENKSQIRHGLATVCCLLSGLQTFAPSYPEAERNLRVLRGLHGFHMYATEFWVDYLLVNIKLDQAQLFESNFFALSCHLAENFTGAKTDWEPVDSGISNPYLALIRNKHYPLYKIVKMVLLEQNKEAIEATSTHGIGDNTQHGVVANDVLALKGRYQMTIQQLLNCSSYAGITFQELEQFKQNFRTSAFTCQLWSCPYAALGFNDTDCLIRHEADHLKHICRVQGCHYPVFTSARLLKNHMAQCHASSDQRLARDSIRKHPMRKGSFRSPATNIPRQMPTPAAAQRPKIPEAFMQHVNKMTFRPPVQLADKYVDAAKWIEEMKERYARALMTMETTKNKVASWEKLITDRATQGNPLKEEEQRQIRLRKDQQLKLYAEAHKWVEGVRKQQGSLQGVAQAQAHANQATTGAAGAAHPAAQPGNDTLLPPHSDQLLQVPSFPPLMTDPLAIRDLHDALAKAHRPDSLPPSPSPPHIGHPNSGTFPITDESFTPSIASSDYYAYSQLPGLATSQDTQEPSQIREETPEETSEISEETSEISEETSDDEQLILRDNKLLSRIRESSLETETGVDESRTQSRSQNYMHSPLGFPNTQESSQSRAETSEAEQPLWHFEQHQQQPQQDKLRQAARHSQLLQEQAQARMIMQQNQKMARDMAMLQSPGMNSLNTPVTRPGGINPMAPQGMVQDGIQLSDQQSQQGIQKPNNAAFNAMLAHMTPHQRQVINGLPPDKLAEVLRRWQFQRQEQMQAMNGNPMAMNSHRTPEQTPEMNTGVRKRVTQGHPQGYMYRPNPPPGLPKPWDDIKHMLK